MILKLIKLPFLLAAIPVLLAFLALQLIGAVLLGLSSIVTHLLASVFLIGAVVGWLVHASPWMVWQAVGIGLFFAFAPSLAAWLLNRVTDYVIRILSFVPSDRLFFCLVLLPAVIRAESGIGTPGNEGPLAMLAHLELILRVGQAQGKEEPNG